LSSFLVGRLARALGDARDVGGRDHFALHGFHVQDHALVAIDLEVVRLFQHQFLFDESRDDATPRGFDLVRLDAVLPFEGRVDLRFGDFMTTDRRDDLRSVTIAVATRHESHDTAQRQRQTASTAQRAVESCSHFSQPSRRSCRQRFQ